MTTTAPSLLALGAIEQYRTDGFLVVPDLLTGAEVSHFLEHEAGDIPPVWKDGLRTHTANPARRALAAHPRVVGIVRQLLGGPPMIVQTMFLNKPAGGGRGIALHQDSYYIDNQPNTLMACWIAMADTDVGNGGLCVVPGSQAAGLRSSHPNTNTAEHASWEAEHTLRARDGSISTRRIHAAEIDDLDREHVVKLRVPRGSGVFFTGLTIHGSYSNPSADRPRPAFAIHYVREGTWVYRTDIQEIVPAA
jgi:phytanoyl-CoA hydroxylase